MKIKMVVAYDGTNYLGWQATHDGPSIEHALQQVLSQIFQEPISLEAASRTDAGVHACHQVVTLTTQKSIGNYPLGPLKRSLNQLLPQQIRVLECQSVASTFHPSLSAGTKEYRYYITTTAIQLPFERHYRWHLHRPLNQEQMSEAATYLVGVHDFQAFANRSQQKPQETTRTLFQLNIVQESPQHCYIQLIGDRFLYKMARNLAGTLAAVGCGEIPPHTMPALLAGKDRTLLGVTAPAHALFLHDIRYPPFEDRPLRGHIGVDGEHQSQSGA